MRWLGFLALVAGCAGTSDLETDTDVVDTDSDTETVGFDVTITVTGYGYNGVTVFAALQSDHTTVDTASTVVAGGSYSFVFHGVEAGPYQALWYSDVDASGDCGQTDDEWSWSFVVDRNHTEEIPATSGRDPHACESF